MGNFKEDIAQVKAMVFDVDGVFTDGGLMLLPEGDFLRRYCAKDGYAVRRAVAAGYKIAVITGGWGAMLEKRFRMLGLEEIHTQCVDIKIDRLLDFMKRNDLRSEQVLYMGDDIPDVACMQHVGVPVCPSDAAVEVLETARYVSQFKGGYGCVRDVIEQVMRAQDRWCVV